MKKTAAAIAFLAASASADLYLEGGFQLNLPQNEFGTAYKHAAAGGNFGGGWHFKYAPFAVGAELGFIAMGKNSSKHNFVTNLVSVDQTIESTAGVGNLIFRVKPHKWIVRPYIDGMIGFKSFQTTTTIINSAKDTLANNQNLSDNTLCAGVRTGISIHPKRKSPVGINIAGQYLRGGEADYLDASNPNCIIETAPGIYQLKTLKSRTDLLTFSLGISVEL